MPPWIHDQFGCNQKNRGEFGHLPSFIHTYTCIHIHADIHTYIYIYTQIYIYWIWFWQMVFSIQTVGQGHGSPPSFLLTSTVPGCWGGVCSHTQMEGVVTVIDPNLPRLIWLGNEISCKFLQLYFGRLRFSESTCAYVAIRCLRCHIRAVDCQVRTRHLHFFDFRSPRSDGIWVFATEPRHSLGTFCHIPLGPAQGFQPGSQSSGLMVHMVLEVAKSVSKRFVTKNKW